jgi:hypothetical protein
VRPSFEHEGAADRVPVAAEQTLPAAVAENDDVGPSRDVLLGQERPSQKRLDAERLEEALSDQSADQGLRLRPFEVIEAERLRRGNDL